EGEVVVGEHLLARHHSAQHRPLGLAVEVDHVGPRPPKLADGLDLELDVSQRQASPALHEAIRHADDRARLAAVPDRVDLYTVAAPRLLARDLDDAALDRAAVAVQD